MRRKVAAPRRKARVKVAPPKRAAVKRAPEDKPLDAFVPRREPENPMQALAARKWQEGLGVWYDAMKAEVSGAYRYQLERELVEAGVLSEARCSEVDVSWLRMRVAYLRQEARREELGLETPPKVQARIDGLDASRELPGWHVDFFLGGREDRRADPRVGRSDDMGTKDKAKAKVKAKGAAKGEGKEPRHTISSLMVSILRRPTVPPNSEIVAEVKKAFPDSRFDGAHVSWYKGAFNAGKLPGQAKGEAFNQPQVRDKKEPEAKPAAKAKGKAAKAPKAEAKPAPKVKGPKRAAAK